MQNQYSGLEKPNKVNLFLVEPRQKLSFQFSALRNQLNSNNIPYKTLIGFDEVKELMSDKVNKNIIVINSSNNINPSDFPRQIFNTPNNQTYFYPHRFKNEGYLPKPENVIELYRRYTGSLSQAKKINLRSIKKDLQKSKERREGELYDNIMIMSQRGSNPQYIQLYNILQNYKKVITINVENTLQNYKDGKSLIILQRQAYDSTNRFINGNRLGKNIDLAVLGYTKGLDMAPNCAIVTDYPTQIIQYIAESGTDLKGAMQRLNLLKASMGSGFNNSTDHNTGVFGVDDGGFISFNPKNLIQRQGEQLVTYNSQGNKALNRQSGEIVTYSIEPKPKLTREGGEEVTYENQDNKKIDFHDGDTVNYGNHIPIASKISEASNNQKAKKPQIKKIKKIENNGNSAIGDNDDAPPIININTVNSQASQNDKTQSLNRINEIPEKKTELRNQNNIKKPVMNWQLFPDRSVQGEKKPNFILLSEKGEVFGEMKNSKKPQVQNRNSIKSMGSISEVIYSHKNTGKSKMEWNLYPDTQKKSQFTKGPSFILQKEKENIPGKLQNQLESPTSKKSLPPRPPAAPQYKTTPYSQPTPLYTENSSQHSMTQIQLDNQSNVKNLLPTEKKIMHWSLYPQKNKKSPYSQGPMFILNILPNNNQPAPVPYAKQPEIVEYKSKDSISQESYENSQRNQQARAAQLIQQKYSLGNDIKQLSQQHRSSYVSYQIDDGNNSSQRIANSSNLPPQAGGPKRSNSQKQSANIFDSNSNNSSGTKMVKSSTDHRNIGSTQYENRNVYSAERPTSRIVRQQPRAADTYYMEPSQKKLEEDRRYEPSPNSPSSSVYRSNNLVSPAITTNNTISYSYTNPYSRTMNTSTLATTTIEPVNRNRQTSPANNYVPASASISSPSNKNLAINPVTSNPIYADINRTIASTYGQQTPSTSNISPANRTTYYNKYANVSPAIQSNSQSTDTTKNYLANLGIDQSKYDIITDGNGVRRYRLKDNYSNDKAKQLNLQSKSIPAQSSISSPRNIVNTYQNIQTHQTNPLTPSATKNVFNFNDYEEHTDERGNKYYTVKKINTKVEQAATIVTEQTPQSGSRKSDQSQALLIESRSQQLGINGSQAQRSQNNMDSSRSRYEGGRYSAQVATSPVQTSAQKFNSTKDIYEPAIIRKESATEAYNFNLPPRVKESNFVSQTKNTQASLQPNKNGVIIEKKTFSSRYQNSPDSKTYTYVNIQKGVDPSTGQIVEVNKRLSLASNSAAKEVIIKEQTSNSTREIYKFESVTNSINSPAIDNKGNQVGISNQNNQRSSQYQYSNQISQASRMTPDSQLTDSKTSSMYKFNAHLYGQTKPYSVSLTNMRIQSLAELEKVNQEFKTLKIANNFSHYIIDTSHPLRYEIEKIPEVQDKIVQVDYAEKVYEYMLQKPLPNEFYDIGFIFVSQKNVPKISPADIVEGYYLVDINAANPPIQIKKQKKIVSISDLGNLALVKKLLLAPNIQHFVFYPRSSEGEISAILSLFPTNKFNKFGYNSRPELQNLFQMHLRNKGRLTRILIFVNPSNLSQIAPLMDHALNHKTFTMICNSKTPVDERTRNQYKRVTFQNNFDFNSYGSVISLANNDKSYIQLNNTDNRMSEYTNDKKDLTNDSKPKIYIQNPHKGVDRQIEKAFPETYDIRFFTQASQIKDRSRDNFILLHRQADNIGSQFDRNIGTLILLGGKKGDRSPSGTVTIQTVSELIQDVL